MTTSEPMASKRDDRIDWARLATSLGLVDVTEPGGWNERGGNEVARNALECILGPERIVDAVEYYISMQPGFELARSVLRLVRPLSAMNHCHKIFRSHAPLADRRTAVELLRSLCDRRVLPWVPDLLADPDPEIQHFGILAVVELSYTQSVDNDDLDAILQIARNHSNERVREAANDVMHRLADGAG